MVDGVGVDDIAIGDEVELVTAVLYSDDDGDKLVWKWRPLEGSTNG
jgi:hypothetical protein